MGNGNTIRVDPFAQPDMSSPEWQAKRYISYQDVRPSARERSNFSGHYNLQLLRNIADIAKSEHIDPYELIALGLQETRLGEAKYSTPDYGDVFNLQTVGYMSKEKKEQLWNIFDKEVETKGFNSAIQRKNIREAAELFKKKEQLADNLYMKRLGRRPTRAEVLQGWQGYGKLRGRYFGKDASFIGWKDIPNGLRILEHIDSLKKSSEIQSIIKGGS